METGPGPMDSELGQDNSIRVSVKQGYTEDSHGGTDSHSHRRSF